MHALITNINGNPNVGLYGFANDHFCILGTEVSHKKAKEIGEVLNVPVHQMNIAGTSLIGAFVAGNNKKILVPGICFDKELKHLDKLGIDYAVIDTDLTALGNNIIANDEGVYVNPEFPVEVKNMIKDALGVPLKQGTIAGFKIVGALAELNKNACIVHRDIENEESKVMERLLGIKIEPGTLNMGTPYINSGLLCNSHGYVIGDHSGGGELVFIDEALGFAELEQKRKLARKKAKTREK